MSLHKMVPIAFGPSGQKHFGAYHPARAVDGAPTRSCGVVLCNPMGWEAIASQRSYRVLADRLAGIGFPVLRFDYSGTGDSAGVDIDRDRVRAWLDGIGLAAEKLKQLSCTVQVSLLGIQLGATLAAVAAAERSDESIASLVMWAPYLTGKAYLRQVRAYRMLNDPTAVAHPGADEEAAGFVLTRATVEDLTKLDLLGGVAPPTRSVLVLGRDAQSPEEKLTARLRAQGAQADFAFLPGYLPMMQEPRKSVVPDAVFAKIAQWLSETHPASESSPAPTPPAFPAVLEDHDVREEALFFGRDERLFGIVTNPVTLPERPLPALIWLNTASDHRIGPNRLYVTLARRLSRLGFTSLRFDPAGVGDGEDIESPEAAHAYSRARLSDVKDVMNWLSSERGAKQFALIGLCSAAYVAFHTALGDRRVAAEILINPQTFVWHEGDSLELAVRRSYGSNRFYKDRLRNPETWERALRGEVNVRGIAGVVGRRLLTLAMRRARRLLPLRSGDQLDVEHAFRRMLRQGTDVLLVFSESDGGLDYLEGHLGQNAEALRGVRRFRFEIVKGADHTFSQRWAQEWLSGLITEHLSTRFVAEDRERAPLSVRILRQL